MDGKAKVYYMGVLLHKKRLESQNYIKCFTDVLLYFLGDTHLKNIWELDFNQCVMSLNNNLWRTIYLLWWRGLHVALWRWWGLHDRLGWRRWWRWRMGVSSGRLVARRRRHRLTRGSHDVAGLRRGVLGQNRGRSLIHGGRLRVLTGALPTKRHLAELRRQLFSLGGIGMMSLVG